jgi:DNA-binding protein H-NS
MKSRSKRKKSSSRRSIIHADRHDLSIVARTPHEEMHDWQNMSADDLWKFHEKVVSVITEKIHAEQQRLEDRLRRLNAPLTSPIARVTSSKDHRSRRPYPEVKPKYRDSSDPSVTWSGRGKLPRWLTQHLSTGKKLEDFKIDDPRERLIS